MGRVRMNKENGRVEKEEWKIEGGDKVMKEIGEEGKDKKHKDINGRKSERYVDDQAG